MKTKDTLNKSLESHIGLVLRQELLSLKKHLSWNLEHLSRCLSVARGHRKTATGKFRYPYDWHPQDRRNVTEFRKYHNKEAKRFEVEAKIYSNKVLRLKRTIGVLEKAIKEIERSV